MSETRQVMGNIGLGNFCKAVLEHKDIKVFSEKYHNTYIFKWDKFNHMYYCKLDDEFWFDISIIKMFISDIYIFDYTWELV